MSTKSKMSVILCGGLSFLVSILYLEETAFFPHRLLPVADALLYFNQGTELSNLKDLTDFPLSRLYVLYIYSISRLTFYVKHLIGQEISILETIAYFNSVLYAASVSSIVWLGSRYSMITGILSGIFMIGFGPAVFYQGVALPIIPVLFLETICIILFYQWASLQKTKYFIILAFILGILIELRPHFLIFVPLLSWLCIFKRKRFKQPVKTSNVFIPLLSLWPVLLFMWINNPQTEVPFRSSLGLNLYIGNHKNANGLYYKIPNMNNTPAGFRDGAQAYASKHEGKHLSVWEENYFWLKKVIRFYTSYPAEGLRLLAKKFQHLLSRKEFPLNYDYAVQLSFSHTLRFLIFDFGFLLPLALVFTFLKLSQPLYKTLRFWFFGYIISLLIFFISSDHRMPLLPLASLLSAGLFNYIYKTVKERAKGKLVVILMMLIPLIYISAKDPTHWSHHQTYHQIGEMSLALNNKKFALKAFKLALSEKRDFIPSLIMVVKINIELGNNAEAASYLKKLLQEKNR